MRRATRAVHAGRGREPARPPAAPPIYQTAPFVFEGLDELVAAFGAPGGEGLYSRYHNPTVRAAEEKLAALEEADDAVAFASGMAAVSSTLWALLPAGSLLLVARELYGGSSVWIDWLGESRGDLSIERVPLDRLVDRLEDSAAPAPTAVYFETPTNPTLQCVDISAVAAAGRARSTTVVVDNTFATPVIQNPLGAGAHLVIHSATKFLGGHSDVVAGVVAGEARALDPVRRLQISAGAVLGPQGAFLLHRGMKTVCLRVERQSESAARIAQLLGDRPEVARVHYPGLDPVGRRQMRSGGAMISADLGSASRARRFVEALEVFEIIPSLGGVESGVVIPALSSHRSLPAAERAALGIGDGLVRFSVGIEDPTDLLEDVARGLAAAGEGP